MSQRTADDTTLAYSKIVESYAHFFDRPEVRLRFLNNTLAHQAASRERFGERFKRFEFLNKSKLYGQVLELWLHRLVLQELQKLLPDGSKQRLQLLRCHKAPFAARLFLSFYKFRHVFYTAGVALLMVALFGVYSAVVWSSQRVNGYLTERYRGRNERRASNQYSAQAQTGTQHLPDYRPEKIWLVEQKDNYERYSNGGRILTTYETTNHPRGYHVFQPGGTTQSAELGQTPIGIVYHSSESDLLPFTSANNDSIEARTRGLLEYVQKNKSYNYVIDRFGQIYRIVRDDEAANHAGNSVWSDSRGIYVGLNESFLGVSFETNSAADSLDEQLTEAQLVAGRLLTQILRSRHQIDDANCVTHGLVSVNPGNMLICYHYDWARNFPFEGMGLSDKYKVAPATITEFGFTYDEEIAGRLGGAVWAGAQAADEAFKKRAHQADTTPEKMRRQLGERYRAQMESQRRARAAFTNKQATIPPAGQSPLDTGGDPTRTQ